MKVFTAALLFAYIQTSVCIAEEAQIAAHVKLTKLFVKKVQLKRSKSRLKPSGVLYGNRQYGYFESTLLTKSKKGYQVELVPPGFRYPLEFYYQYKTKGSLKISKMIAKKRFKSPLPAAYRGIKTKVEGRFSANFFILSASLPKSRLLHINETTFKPDLPFKNQSRFSFAMIVNRFGEIVWTYLPHVRNSFFNAYVYMKPLKKGRYGLILGKKDGYFAVVDYKGQEIKLIDLKNSDTPYPMHHDFDIGPDRKLYTITNKLHVDGETKKSYLTNAVLQVDLKSLEPKIVADLMDHYDPKSALHWVENKEKDRFVTWGEKLADHDFFHTNSLGFYPDQGYLLSFKHLDRIVMFDESFKNLKWSVGRTGRDTFRVEGDAVFSHLHSPELIGKKRLLVFDNGFERQQSRLLELRLEGGKAKESWSFQPKPGLYSKNRSSVVQMDNGDILALFVDPVVKGKAKKKNSRSDILLEVDYKTKRETARMRLIFFSSSPGYRAVPIQTIGMERYVGSELMLNAKKKRSAKRF